MKEKVVEVVYGVKLVERTCACCPNTFRVPASCPQKVCSEFCRDLLRKRPKSHAELKVKGRNNKRKLSYKLKRSDYA